MRKKGWKRRIALGLSLLLLLLSVQQPALAGETPQRNTPAAVQQTGVRTAETEGTETAHMTENESEEETKAAGSQERGEAAFSAAEKQEAAFSTAELESEEENGARSEAAAEKEPETAVSGQTEALQAAAEGAETEAAAKAAGTRRAAEAGSSQKIGGTYIDGYTYDGASSPVLVKDGTGEVIFCMIPSSSPPFGKTVSFRTYGIGEGSDEELQLLARIMYYGYQGGGNHLAGYSDADQNAITHFALSYVWMVTMGHSYGRDWTSTGYTTLGTNGQTTVLNYIDWCKTADPVEGTLYLAEYYNASGHSYQDLAYGSFTVNNTPKMDPIGILLKKVDAKTGNDVRHVG